MPVCTAMPVSIAGSGKLEITTEWEMTKSDEKLYLVAHTHFPQNSELNLS